MTKTFKTHFNFALLWSSLVLGGALVGFSLGAFLVRDFDDREYALAVFLIIFVFGLFIGTGQWLALMIRLRNIWWWIPATAIGYSVGGFCFFFILAMLGQAFLGFDELYGGAYPWIQITLTLLLTGMVTGALQWFTLGRKPRTSIQWLLVSGLSLLIGFLYSVSPANAYESSSTFLRIAGILLYAVITGVFAGPIIVSPETNYD